MFTAETQQTLTTIAENTRVTFRAIDFKLEVPYLMADDAKALDAAGLPTDGHGTNASSERWIINTTLTAASMKILADSTLTYKHIPAEKQWWRWSPI
jgi:hypothetical protein